MTYEQEQNLERLQERHWIIVETLKVSRRNLVLNQIIIAISLINLFLTVLNLVK